MTTKKTLVLGASLKPHRYSNLAIKRFVQHNQPVVAVGLKVGEVGGIKIETGKPNFKDIDTVTLYMNAQRQRDFYNYLIDLKPKRVIFNPGTENPELYTLLKQNKIEI